MCGNKMSELTQEEKSELSYGTIVINGEDQSEYFFCDHCQLPRTFHHPFHGLSSSAGDSWSVSFIK